MPKAISLRKPTFLLIRFGAGSLMFQEPETFSLYTVNGTNYKLTLSSLNKQIIFDEQSMPKKIEYIYSNEYVTLTKTVVVENTSYPLKFLGC